MGTELSDRGFDVDRDGWSARALLDAPELVLQIHQDYVSAGANLLTTNTFRTFSQNLRSWDCPLSAEEMTRRAVELARGAAGDQCEILGSIAPVGDCYEQGKTGFSAGQKAQIEEHVNNLIQAGVDGFLIETQTSFPEMLYSVQICRQHPLPILVSMVTPNGNTMLDGTPVREIWKELEVQGVCAIGCNCIPVEIVPAFLSELKGCQLPRLVYANSSRCDPQGRWHPTAGADCNQHTQLAAEWMNQGVRILGGCCGTNSKLIEKFAEQFAALLSQK